MKYSQIISFIILFILIQFSTAQLKPNNVQKTSNLIYKTYIHGLLYRKI